MDTQHYFELLAANTKELVNRLENYNSDALRFKQANEWSILEIAEHIAITDSMVLGILQSDSQRDHEADERFGSARLEKMLVTMRNRKVTAPNALEPRGQMLETTQLVSAVSATRTVLRDSILNGAIQPGPKVYPHPVMGDLTVNDWLYFIVHHTERHLQQMDDQFQRYEAVTKER